MPHPDGVLLRAWGMEVRAACVEPVLPDGCRDLILRVDADGRPHWFVSPLADGVMRVSCVRGERYAGFRLHPATRIDERALLDAARRADDDDPATALRLLGEHARIDTRVAEALAALAEARGVAAACARLGVSERTLERLLRGRADARTPRFWHALARARRAARALDTTVPLAALAADHGYADQAHLSRELRRWFGRPPGRLRADPAFAAQIAEPGYA
ncbi:AraC family transcriptional regulator [Pseudothauera nasutitermitis]|uniref:AraC family transcriptional regulator n=1 Tax=Pseudothauera nasutitermitis TaxID=2565930 RepID=A0A4S4AU45_9RHOO|nr:helix-turn-helix domain-containing protein [Pseudothauera nasutitermitis]THF63036.1 AraC family transcriptional regulator [Pseudothauera nasutitermitis]